MGGGIYIKLLQIYTLSLYFEFTPSIEFTYTFEFDNFDM